MSRWVLPAAVVLLALTCRAQELEANGVIGRLSLVANPVAEAPPGSALAGQLEVEPSFKAAVRLLPFLTVGAGYSAAFGPLASPVLLADQAHRLFGVLDLEWGWGQLTLSIGYGLNGPEKWIASLAFEFDLGT